MKKIAVNLVAKQWPELLIILLGIAAFLTLCVRTPAAEPVAKCVCTINGKVCECPKSNCPNGCPTQLTQVAAFEDPFEVVYETQYQKVCNGSSCSVVPVQVAVKRLKARQLPPSNQVSLSTHVPAPTSLPASNQQQEQGETETSQGPRFPIVHKVLHPLESFRERRASRGASGRFFFGGRSCAKCSG